MERNNPPRLPLLKRFLLLDLYHDPMARPIFIYAAGHVMFGAFLYHWLEGRSWLDSLYFVIVTLATIGYGDLSPTRPIQSLLRFSLQLMVLQFC